MMEEKIFKNTEAQIHPQFTITEENKGEDTKKDNHLLPKIKKKKKLLIISMSSLIILFVGIYSFTLFSKIEKMNGLNAEKKVLEAKYNDITTVINHHSTLLSLKSYAECYQTTSGVKGGSAFEINYKNDYFPLHENTEKDIESALRACTPRKEVLHIEGANDLTQAINVEIKEAYVKNIAYVKEAKAIVADWKVFVEESEKSGSGLIESDVYNHLRTLAAKAMGVNPSTIGDTMDFSDLHDKVKDRLKAIDDKQMKVSADKVEQFMVAHADGKTKEILQSEVKEKSLEDEQLGNEISDLESRIQTKKGDLFNPFK